MLMDLDEFESACERIGLKMELGKCSVSGQEGIEEEMKGLMRVSYHGSDMFRGWRGIGSPRESM